MDNEDFNLNESSSSSENAYTMPLSQAASFNIFRQQCEIKAKPVGQKTDHFIPFYKVNIDKKKCKFC